MPLYLQIRYDDIRYENFNEYTRKKTSRTPKTPSLSTSSQETFISLFHPTFILRFRVLPIPIFQESMQASYVNDYVQPSRFTAFGGLLRFWYHLLKPFFPMAPTIRCVPQRLGHFLFQFLFSSAIASNLSKACRQSWIVCARFIITTLSALALSFVISVGDGMLGGGLCVCVWENGWSGVHQKPHSNQLTPNMFENLGKPADLKKNEGRFILMLQPLGLVVSWAKANKPSCWHVLASLSQGYDVGHVRVEPAAEGRRALRVQCREGCFCHCRDTGERHLRTDWHARFEDFDRDDAKSATCYSEKIPLDNCVPAFEAIVDKAKGGSSQILNMRAQYTLHSVVATKRKTSQKRQGHLQLPPRLHPRSSRRCATTPQSFAVARSEPWPRLSSCTRLRVSRSSSSTRVSWSVSYRSALASSG